MKKRSGALKKIKRFFIFLIILAAAGAVFYFGFYQFQMPADTYGVIFTKYTGNGWHTDVLMPGQLRFEWEGLLPVNLNIERFNLLPERKRISLTGELPSAEAYATYLEGRPDFSYSFTFDISYTIKADQLSGLVSGDFLRPGNLDDWMSDIENKLSSDAVEFISSRTADEGFMQGISFNYRLLEDALIDELSAKFNYLEFIGFVPVDISLPDMKLYTEGKRQYYEMERLHNDIQTATIEETSSRLIEESAKLELLEKYGAVFSKYPELIQYYSIFSGSGENLIPSMQLPGQISGSAETGTASN